MTGSIWRNPIKKGDEAGLWLMNQALSLLRILRREGKEEA